MAIAIPSPIIGGVSGKLCGVTFRNTRRGLVVAKSQGRRRAAVRDQEGVRIALAQYQRDWMTAMEIDRASFVAAARTLQWPNRLGIRKKPSGRELFLAMNMMFNPSPHSPYLPSILGCSGAQTPGPIEFELTASVSGGVDVHADNGTVFLGAIYQVGYVARRLAAGQEYEPRNWLRVGRVNTAFPDYDWRALIEASTGGLVEGERIAFRLIWIYYFSVYSAPQSRFATVAA